MKELLKLVHICQSYRKNESGTFFYGPPGEVQSNQKSNPKFVTVTRENVTNYSNRITKIEK